MSRGGFYSVDWDQKLNMKLKVFVPVQVAVEPGRPAALLLVIAVAVSKLMPLAGALMVTSAR